jgi:hypothetical protein
LEEKIEIRYILPKKFKFQKISNRNNHFQKSYYLY